MQIPILDLSAEIEHLWQPLNEAIQKVLKEASFINGPDVHAFEQEMAEYLGVKYAVGLNSGTDALTIGLRAMGIGPGDEVITTSFSFFATAEAVLHTGARTVFVDIDPLTYNIDPSLIEQAVTMHTKAIIPVHLYGHPADMTSIQAIARKYNLRILEDVAQALGATWQGRRVAAIGDVGALSFFPSKNLGGFGDGGMLVTHSEEISELARMLRSHGSKKKYYNEMTGYNSRLDTLHAAMLRVKLPYLNAWNAGRLGVARQYEEVLGHLRVLKTPLIPSDGEHVFHQYTVSVQGGLRDELQEYLRKRGVSTMVYYPKPIHELPQFREQSWALPQTEKAAREVLSLPIGFNLSAEHIAYVAACIQTFEQEHAERLN